MHLVKLKEIQMMFTCCSAISRFKCKTSLFTERFWLTISGRSKLSTWPSKVETTASSSRDKSITWKCWSGRSVMLVPDSHRKSQTLLTQNLNLSNSKRIARSSLKFHVFAVTLKQSARGPWNMSLSSHAPLLSCPSPLKFATSGCCISIT
jgi:hypothetical protein